MTKSPKLSEAYEKILTSNLQRVIDFQKFAEAKNAALLAVSSAWVMASINILIQRKTLPDVLGSSLSLTLFCSICAGLVALWSFFPRLKLPKFMGGAAAGPHPKNLLYFGDISSLPIKTFESEILERYLSLTDDLFTPEYIHDLVIQIGINSKITERKMRLFRFGVILIFAAAITLLFPSIELISSGYKSLWSITPQ